ncbi:MAG: hypothetical protein ACRCT8_01575 [Lacipirellulaceae bacterium]
MTNIRLRFGLRGLLVATTVVAALVGVGAYAVNWRRESQAIIDDYYRVRTADAPTVAVRRSFLGRSYAVANYRCEVKDGAETVERLPSTDDDVKRRSSGEVWVTPPGEWVTEANQAVRLLIDNL